MKSQYRYYAMPAIKSGKTKVVRPAELIVAAVLLVVLLCFYPLEIAAGIGGTGDVRREEITALMQEYVVPAGCFDRMFQYSAVQNGGGMQPASLNPDNEDTFYQRRRFMLVDGYHKYTTYSGLMDWTKCTQHKGPDGMIVNGSLIGVQDGYAYMDNMKGVYGQSSIDVKEGLYKENGEPDYAAITKLLIRSDKEELNFGEAASIYALMQENILIGYADGQAWFADRKENGTDIYHGTASGVKMIGAKEEVFQEGYVVDNEYLFYSDGADFHVVSLYHDFGLRGGLADKEAEWGKLEQIGYGVVELGQETKRVLFVKSEKKLLKLLFSSNSPEYYEFGEDALDEKQGSMSVTAGENKVIAWLEEGNGYHYYSLNVA